jgi:phospholipid/cholesterol/gamma-HCH transport system substrate-binding protein
MIGAFVAAGLVLVGVMFWVLESAAFKPKYRVSATFTYAGGIREGTPVHMAGKPIGAVKQVEFQPEGDKVLVAVVMEIEKQYRIKADSKLTVGSVGLLGEKIIEFSLGSASSGYLPEDGTARLEGTVPPGLEDLQKSLDSAVGDVKVTISKVNLFLDSLNDEVFKADLKRAVAGLADTADKASATVTKVDEFVVGADEFVGKLDTAATKLNEILDSAAETVKSLNEIVGKVSTLADDAGTAIGQIGDEVETLAAALKSNSDKLNEVLENVDGLVRDAREGKGTLGQLLADDSTGRKLDELLRSLKKTSDSLAATSDFLRKNPNSLLFGRDEEEGGAKPAADWRDRK